MSKQKLLIVKILK